MKRIDINCDLGEGLDNDEAIMPLISSCNIACGAHAGDEYIMNRTVDMAVQHNVKIGAHPSFPDRENFGRKYMEISAIALQSSLESQINKLQKVINNKSKKMHHIKVHGALYNAAAQDETISKIIINAIKNTTENIFIYAPFNSVLSRLSELNNIPVKYEVFIDRNYNIDGSLVSRSKSNSSITNKEEALRHVLEIVNNERIRSDQTLIDTKADTYCIHGDNPKVLEILEYIKEQFAIRNISIC